MNTISSRATTRDSGFVLFGILGIVAAVALTTALITTLALFSMRMASLHAQSRQAYWLARSVARHMLHLAAANKLDQGETTTQYGPGAVQVSATCSGSVWTVKVRAVDGSAVDTVTFAYNADTHTVMEWMDNSA